MIENIDPNTIEDEGLRQVVINLMNLVETLSSKVSEQSEAIQRLRDEVKRLKGEQGNPTFKPKKQALMLSSEKERHEAKSRHKAKKQSQLRIDRVEIVRVDQQHLPDDAQFKGYEDVIVQDIECRTETITFRKEKYYSKSQKRTYLATLPVGYTGQFGPKVKAWILTLYYADGMSQPTIIDLLQTVGLQISAGQLSDLLIKDQEPFHAERAQIVQAGLASSAWHHLDSTGTTVNGINQNCHILCNSLYTAYSTVLAKDRMTLLRVLQGGADPLFQISALAVELLRQLGVSAKWHGLLPVLLQFDQTYTESQLDLVLDRYLPPQGDTLRKRIKEALAIATYRTQTTYPVVKLLLCDDAPQFTGLTDEVALCWIHEYRHYKKLMPRFFAHSQILNAFAEDFWQFYRDLQAYRDHPSRDEATTLRATFDQLFGQTSGYQQLDERLAQTLAKKESLLMVLSHPEILLHNNPAELGARQRVRKRDVSLQARTPEGIGAWDTFQTLVGTANKLGVNIYEYFHDRIVQTHLVPRLASLIEKQSLARSLSASWAATP
ncbi:MAG: transposase [Ktedonobacteraceae bacterium]